MKQFLTLTAFAMLLTYNALAQNVTKQEALALAKQIEQTIKEGDPTFTNNIFHAETFSRNTLAQMYEVDTSGFYDIIIKAMSNIKLGDKIVSELGDGYYSLVKQYEKDGIQHLIFRMFDGAATNYHDFQLMKVDDSLKASDLYIYLSGEDFSTTYANILVSMLKQNKMSSAYNLRMVKYYMSSRDYQQALSTFKKIGKIRDTKAGQLIYLQILSEIDDNKYMKAISRYRKDFPNDPSLHLVMIDYYYLKKDFNMALFEIDALDKIIDKDPFLDYYRGLMYKSISNNKLAIQHFEQLHTVMPSFDYCSIELIVLYLENGDKAKAKTIISEYRNEHGEDDLKTLAIAYPQYEEQLLFKD